MDITVQKALSDKLYDKRKGGALELESLIRDSLAANDHDRIAKVVHQLCHDYAYAVHQPHARNGGLIGLAAAAIALGGEVARYLREIVPPVLACFTDQDARVRYYACESMYNIAKVAKGEVLIYFNDIFDALCKLAADTELSVKNGAELLDRLVKDIVSESAASYVSVLEPQPEMDPNNEDSYLGPRAFKLGEFIPLLQERIYVLNPFTRTFLVSWITLLDSIPDLELVTYLPSFLGGLLKFLSDPNQDVHTTTKVALDRFLSEIKKISNIKRNITESRKAASLRPRKSSNVSVDSRQAPKTEDYDAANDDGDSFRAQRVVPDGEDAQDPDHESNDGRTLSSTGLDDDDGEVEEEYIPGQDVQVDHAKILDILLNFLRDSSEEEIQTTTLRWIETFFDICPEDMLPFVPRLLSQVLPALSHDVELVRTAADRVNRALTTYIMSLPEDNNRSNLPSVPSQISVNTSIATRSFKEPEGVERRDTSLSTRLKPPSPEMEHKKGETSSNQAEEDGEQHRPESPRPSTDLDYDAAVNSLTLQFLNEHENSRVAALSWLLMLHRKSPRKILAIHEGTFPALLKTLSDPSEVVVTRDLLLLSQICKNSDDSYFSVFMVSLLKLFCTDRRLLETRGNLIIRQLCLNLSPERIYRTLADCLEKDEDIEFASIMVQNLNNNLITAPELAEMRKRLRNLESREGQAFFVALFRSWCHNAVATFSLCLLAQAYEQAYHLLQIFTELEMTVNMLIQIDKLVQLLESPVFTYLRLQLLEPERFPYLYKCLYGLLMLLPQSSAFAALKNRLNSVSAIGYLHIPSRPPPTTPGTSSSSFADRPNRLKSREDPGIRWNELLEKFRSTQERARRANQRNQGPSFHQSLGLLVPDDDIRQNGRSTPVPRSAPPMAPPGPAGLRPSSAASLTRPPPAPVQPPPGAGHQKSKSGLSQLGRFARVSGKGKSK
ncbi:VAC14 protein [Elsinoe australis]|uniref:VAC14 protein n=1 Tax=Elsinoe australis TaxID=40998 RepID=A0A4U7BEL6_9PEZI|nr:VAC14 protein [Elsinoe australis]